MHIIRILSLTILLGVIHAQEIQTYGPWKGYWVQATLTAYSPHDAIDKDYHETKGKWRWITADGTTDVRRVPYGLAGSSRLSFGTQVFIPAGYGYLDQSRNSLSERCFVIDDRGGLIESQTTITGRLHFDVRYRTEYSALKFGKKEAWVFIIVSNTDQ